MDLAIDWFALDGGRHRQRAAAWLLLAVPKPAMVGGLGEAEHSSAGYAVAGVIAGCLRGAHDFGLGLRRRVEI